MKLELFKSIEMKWNQTIGKPKGKGHQNFKKGFGVSFLRGEEFNRGSSIELFHLQISESP